MSGLAHCSVLLDESVEALAIKPDGVYVDGTFGRGGHSRKILESLSERGRLVVFDKDHEAVAYFEKHFANDERVSMHHCSFADMAAKLKERGLFGAVDGVLLDLGVSSPQLDEAQRGFSFLRDGPLDMRMGNQGITAAQWLAEVSLSELRYVLKVYGEERFAALIAKKIVERREVEPFETTLDLAGFIEQVVPTRQKGKHPATRSFQAIRIHINAELDDLKGALDSVVGVLAESGRLAVISFHSLEDRIVKRFLKAQDQGPKLPRNIPINNLVRDPHLQIKGKPIKASGNEVEQNVRSRSAVLRVAVKVAA